MIYDIVIVGGGPAGATFARLIAGEKNVLLLEKSERKDAARKVCGGLLAPDAQRELKRQGIVLPDDVFVFPQVDTVLSYDADANLTQSYPRNYKNIDRARFDAHLLSLIPNSVEIRRCVVFKSYAEEEDGLRLTVYEGPRQSTIRTKALVSAEGFGSLVRTQLTGGNDLIRKYICIQEWVHAKTPLKHHLAHFSKRVTNYYSWVIPKENMLVLGSALPQGSSAKPAFQTFKEDMVSLYELDPTPLTKESHGLVRPKRFRDFVLGSGRVFLIGEAAGLVSPSSGEGISYALQSARLLTQAWDISPNQTIRKYRRRTFGMRLRLWLKNGKSFVIYTPFFRRLVMRSGITARKPSDGH